MYDGLRRGCHDADESFDDGQDVVLMEGSCDFVGLWCEYGAVMWHIFHLLCGLHNSMLDG